MSGFPVDCSKAPWMCKTPLSSTILFGVGTLSEADITRYMSEASSNGDRDSRGIIYRDMIVGELISLDWAYNKLKRTD
jgi:hypothetical protein